MTYTKEDIYNGMQLKWSTPEIYEVTEFDISKDVFIIKGINHSYSGSYRVDTLLTALNNEPSRHINKPIANYEIY